MFTWIKTDNEKVEELNKNLKLVVGGYECDYNMFIGRAEYKGEVSVGKVLSGHKNWGLLLTDEGKEINIKEFEILAYNPLPMPEIDVRVDE